MTANRAHGFSLIEILVATTITVALFGLIFQLFHQNERIFRDQNLILEMRQGARAAISQIADDVRAGGQGVPVYVAGLRPELSEATVVVLAGSDSRRLQLRAGLSNTASYVTSVPPVDLPRGVAVTLTVADASIFSNAIGTTPAGRHVFIYGTTMQGPGWVRAAVNFVAGSSRSLSITPAESGDEEIRFSAAAAISLEEAVAIYRDIATSSIRRTTSTNMTNPANPVWAPANELATNVIDLAFTYYDAANSPITPDTLERRSQVARIDTRIVVRATAALSDGSRPTYAVATRSIPRNLRVR